MTTPSLSPVQWLGLDPNIRREVASIFGIRQIRPAHVVGNKLADSGHDWHDIYERITVASMTDHLKGLEIQDIPEDYFQLWDLLVLVLSGAAVSTNPKTNGKRKKAAPSL